MYLDLMERTNSNRVGSHQLACHHTLISKLLTSVERKNPLMGYSTHFDGDLSEFDIWLHKILKIMPDIRNVSFLLPISNILIEIFQHPQPDFS